MVDYLANTDDELEKPRVKKQKLPKVAEPKDDANDEYEKSLPRAKRVKREKSLAKLTGFKKAQAVRAQNIVKRKEEKEREIAEKYLAKNRKQNEPEVENEVVAESESETETESEEEVYIAPKKTKKAPPKKAQPKKKSKRKVVVYMSSSSEDDDDDSSSEDEQPAPNKKSRIARQLPNVNEINYRTYFA